MVQTTVGQTGVSSAAPESQTSAPLKAPLIVAYSAGQIVETMISGVVTIFLLFYLNLIVGLPPNLAGLVLFLSLAFDAVVDPLIGAASDGWKSPWGRRHPFLLVGTITLPLSIIGLFIIPFEMTMGWLFVYVLTFNILMRCSTSIFVLTYCALMPELSRDYDERFRIMVVRVVMGALAMAGVLWLSYGVIFKIEDSLSQASSYVPFAFLLAGVVLFAGLISTFGTFSEAKRLPKIEESHAPLSRIVTEIVQLFKNKSFTAMFFGASIIMTAMIFVNSLNIYAFQYYWKLSPEQMQYPTVAQAVGLALSIPTALFLIRRLEKRDLLLIEGVILACAFAGPVLLRYFGIIQPETNAALAFVVFSGVIFGLSMGLGAVSYGSMVADTSDEHDLLFGVRREGLCFASLVFANKVAMGLGGLLAGLGLTAIGFPDDPQSAQGAAQLTDQVIQRLGFLWGPVFAVGALACLPVFITYRLDRKTHGEIMVKIATRNAESDRPAIETT